MLHVVTFQTVIIIIVFDDLMFGDTGWRCSHDTPTLLDGHSSLQGSTAAVTARYNPRCTACPCTLLHTCASTVKMYDIVQDLKPN